MKRLIRLFRRPEPVRVDRPYVEICNGVTTVRHYISPAEAGTLIRRYSTASQGFIREGHIYRMVGDGQ